MGVVSSSAIAQRDLDLPSRSTYLLYPTWAASWGAHARHRGSQARGTPPTP